MKHRIVHRLQKYVFNPPIKLALAVGLPLPEYAFDSCITKTGDLPLRLAHQTDVDFSVDIPPFFGLSKRSN